MARVKVDVNKRQLKLKVVRDIERVTNDPQLKEEIGIFATQRIAFQARVGQPLNNQGKFPALKSLTVQKRRELARYNATDSTYQAGRSNVTFTGQLLDSLSFNQISNGVELFFKGKRRPYRTKTGRRSGRVPTNAEVAERLEDIGFVIFSKRGIERNQKFRRQIDAIVRRFLRRKIT